MKRRRALRFTITVVLTLCAVCGVWLCVQQWERARSRQLIDALSQGDTKTALALVNLGADPNTPFAPPLPLSFSDLLHYLLHRKEKPIYGSDTAFMLVCGTGWNSTVDQPSLSIMSDNNLPLLQAMLAHGADIHARTSFGLTALHYAAIADHGRTVEWLLRDGAGVDTPDGHGRTPLMLAASHRTPNAIKALLLHGANPNARDKAGQTALHYAINSPDTEFIIPILMAHGADPNFANQNGPSLLQWARQAKRSDLVRLLTQGAK